MSYADPGGQRDPAFQTLSSDRLMSSGCCKGGRPCLRNTQSNSGANFRIADAPSE